MSDSNDRVSIELIDAGEHKDRVVLVLSKVKGLTMAPQQIVSSTPCTVATDVPRSAAEKLQGFLEKAGAMVMLEGEEEEELISPEETPLPGEEEQAEIEEQKAREHRAQVEQRRIDNKRRLLQGTLKDIDRKVTDARGSFTLMTGIGYGVLAFIGLFLIGFPFIFVPSLTHLIGDRVCDGAFEVATSHTHDGTSYHYYCIRDGVREGCEVVTLYALLMGSGVLCALWTLYLPVRYLRMRGAVESLKLERSAVEDALFELEKPR